MHLIIDCNGLAYRSVYAMSELSFKKHPTGVIYGFLEQIYQLANKFQTNQFVFCWDSRRSYRRLDCDTYKQRPIDPKKKEIIDKAHQQFKELYKNVLPDLGFQNNYRQSGYEADDLIAWCTMRFPDHYIIVSRDNDLLQLLVEDRHCSVSTYDYDKVFTAKDFITKYGIEPQLWAWVKGYAGCASDTVAGIPGIGKGTAVKYLNNVLKDGVAKSKIESKEGKEIFKKTFNLVALPYAGDEPISMKEPIADVLFSLDFMDVFKKYGLNSFLIDKNFDKWKEAFGLQKGRR
jgi:DNA polymerase-1